MSESPEPSTESGPESGTVPGPELGAAAPRRPRRAVSPESRTRQPTEVRRRMILQAAVPLVAERGASGVGLRDIARAAGISVGTVTYHFASVREILTEAIATEIEAYYGPLGERMLSAPTATEGMEVLVAGVFNTETDRHWRLWADNWAGAGAPAGAAVDERQTRRYEDWSARVAELIHRGCASGEFRCADVAETAARFTALVDGLALRRLRGAPPLPLDQAQAHLRRFLEAELGLPLPP